MNKKGFTLIEALVGSALMLIIFLGIFGAFRLGMKMIGLSKNKIIATAIANQRLELIRNLPYQSIGVTGGYPDGVLESATSTLRSNTQFAIETRVDYVIDALDGVAFPDDDCPNDYKRAQIKVFWTGQFGGEVELLSDIVPKNLAQECAEAGGVLSVGAFDAFGVMIDSPLIEIKDSITENVITSATPSSGEHFFSLPAGTYRVVVSKSGWSQEQTYSSGEIYQGKTIITPEKPNPIVIEDRLSEISFSIDKLSSFSAETLSPWGAGNFSDSFLDNTKISEILPNLSLSGGEVNFLFPIVEGTSSLASVPIAPGSLTAWDEFSWSDNTPVDTDIRYQVLHFFEDNWVLIPDSDLAGNSAGFDSSPLDLLGLDKTTYPQLEIKANFSTLDLDVSPSLYDWQVSWRTSNPTPIGNVAFKLEGQKIVGSDASDNPIYKYSQDHVSNSGGTINISSLEWDLYIFIVDSASGLDLSSIDPSPQPISLAPDANQAVKMYLDAENSLLVTVQNIETLEPVFAASVRLYHAGLGYDVTQYTNEAGQTYFITLEPGVYNLDVTAASYAGLVTTASIFGDAVKTVKLQQVE